MELNFNKSLSVGSSTHQFILATVFAPVCLLFTTPDGLVNTGPNTFSIHLLHLHVLSHYGLAGPPVYHSTPKPCCYPGALFLKRELCLKKKPNNQTVNLTVVS